MRATAAVLLVAAMAAGPAQASDRATVEWSGFVEPEFRATLTDDPVWFGAVGPDAGLELRAFPTAYVDAATVLHVDVQHRPQGETRIDLDLRELWVRLYDGSFTLAAGRQLYTWGMLGEQSVADIINPQQWQDPTQSWIDRKLGVWSLQGVWEASMVQLQAVVLPVFTASQVPGSSPFVKPDLPPALARRLGAAGAGLRWGDASLRGPGLDLADTDVHVRAYFPVEVGDFALAAGLFHDQIGSLRPSPAAATGAAIERHHGRFGTVAAAATVPFLEAFSVGVESVLFIPEDVDGTDPYVRNLTVHSAAQVKGWVSAQMQLSLGLMDQQILRDDSPGEADDEEAIPPPAGSPWLALDSHVAYAGLLYRWGDAFHRLSLTYVLAYLNDGHLVQPELNFGIVGGLRLKVGGQWFAGPRQYGFGRADEFSNIYVGLRADF